MISSVPEIRFATAREVRVTDEELMVELDDARTVTVPVHWYPRLAHATANERAQWELIGRGEGIHWPALDEDISVESLLLGRPSGESQRSFARWIEARASAARPAPERSRRAPARSNRPRR